MSNVAKFDLAAADAYIIKAFAADSAFSFQSECYIPSSAPDLGASFDPDLMEVGRVSTSNYDEIFVKNLPPVGFSTNAVEGGTCPVDTWFTLLCEVTNVGGNNWDVTWTADGTVIGTNSAQTFDVGASDPFPLVIGGRQSSAGAGYVLYQRNVVVKDHTGATIFTDPLDTDFSAWDSVTGAATIEDPFATVVEGAGGVRISIAFDDLTLEDTPTWTDITAAASSLVASYDIQRGREYELDRTEASTATININDRDGILDPTNSTGPYYTKIEPDLQIKIELWNPVALEWQRRFRGWIEDFDYDLDPSQQVYRLRISCYDIIALLTFIEMLPGTFGDTPPTGSESTVFFDNATFQDRITQVFGNAGIPSAFLVAFTGNVDLLEATYSAAEPAMTPIQDSCDAEFPGVSNAYTDRLGRLAAHGRLAVFDPATVAAGAGSTAWDFHHWKAGDGAAVNSSPTDTAHMRPPFTFNRGRSKIINSAYCYPADIIETDKPGQLVTDPTSIGEHGIQSWSKEGLLVQDGTLTGNNGKDECKAYAQFYVTNNAEPKNRISAITIRSISPDALGAATTWDLLCKADIADLIDVTIGAPDSGGFNLEPCRIEGVRESCQPLNPDYADVTLTIDVSPQALFDDAVGLDGS